MMDDIREQIKNFNNQIDKLDKLKLSSEVIDDLISLFQTIKIFAEEKNISSMRNQLFQTEIKQMKWLKENKNRKIKRKDFWEKAITHLRSDLTHV